MTFAHVAGVPVEELLPVAAYAATGGLVALRAYVGRLWRRRAPTP